MKPTKEQQLQRAKDYAKSREGGECLSKEYVNNRTQMIWKCSKMEHGQWLSIFQNIVNENRWCPECAGKLSPNNYLKKAKEYAKNKGGECLSTEYKNAKTKMIWQCSNKEHQNWFADYNSIVNTNTWCPECAGNIHQPQKSFEKAKKHAKNKGGECLSTEYKNAYTRMLWKCSVSNHKPWFSKISHILNGSWCPECGLAATIAATKERKKEFNGLGKAKKLAQKNNGKCLSEEYLNAHEKMVWKCSHNSHPEWLASYKSIYDGSWCPKCADFIFYKESKIRNILNYLLDTNFEKVSLEWNINPKTKRLLELDGYSKNLNIAFEFQGLHHYQPVFKSSEEKLEYIQYKDKVKKENCKNNNVKLIIIDDGKYCDDNESLLHYVLHVLEGQNIKILKNIDMNEVNNVLSKMTNFQEEALQKARKYAESRKGKCLSEIYVNSNDKLEWKCNDEKHPSFFANLRVIYRNSWCNRCATKEQWKNKPLNKKSN